jgi:hypothetical protein
VSRTVEKTRFSTQTFPEQSAYPPRPSGDSHRMARSSQ